MEEKESAAIEGQTSASVPVGEQPSEAQAQASGTSPRPEPVSEVSEIQPETQAERLFRKFGGVLRLAFLLKALGKTRHPSALYRWTYPRSRDGTDGLVPTRAWPDIMLAARVAGVLITPEDYDPRPTLRSRRARRTEPFEIKEPRLGDWRELEDLKKAATPSVSEPPPSQDDIPSTPISDDPMDIFK